MKTNLRSDMPAPDVSIAFPSLEEADAAVVLKDFGENSNFLQSEKTKSPRSGDKKLLHLNDFRYAFDKDDFYDFENFLQATFYGPEKSFCLAFLRFTSSTNLFDVQRHSECSVFEEILSSNDAKTAKYISAILKHYKLWENEDFLRQKNQQEKLYIHLVLQSASVENFFSFLVFDWFNPDAKHTYALILKSRQFKSETGRNLLERLYEIIDSDEHKIYQNVCLRIIYQTLHELDMEKQSSEAFSENEEFLCMDEAVMIQNQEYKAKVLEVLVVFLIKTDAVMYETRKSQILLIFADSPFEWSFFKLAFLLKERKYVKFEAKFEQFIVDARGIHGDYYQVILKPFVRLLSRIAERHNLLKTSEFIFRICPFIEVNSTVMTNFYDVQEFKVFNIYPFKSQKLNKLHLEINANQRLSEEDLVNIEIICNDYKFGDERKKKDLRDFLFGRSNFDIDISDSIFERILSTPDTSDLIKLVWQVFDLSTREEILTLKNSQGRLLMSYVIDSKDDKNLLTFLLPEISYESKFVKNKDFLKMLNNQFAALTGRTLYEHYLLICLDDIDRERKNRLSYKFFVAIFSLLEEINSVGIICQTVPVDKLLELANDEQKYFQLLKDFNEESEVTAEMRKAKFYIDDLLANIFAYWTSTDENFESHKSELMQLSPIFEMIFNIIDGNEEELLKSFTKSLEKLERSCRERYGDDDSVAHYITSFLFVLLLASIKNDRCRTIDRILSHENFATVNFKFPSNIKTSTTCQYVAYKLLEHGHEIGKNQIPQSWIPPKTFKEFLDSRIVYNNEDLVELDCSILLHPHTRKYQIKSKDDVDNKLIFWEDTESLSHIVNNASLENFITHPVISTYINLKQHKFKSIYKWNFLLFLAFFVFPISFLVEEGFARQLGEAYNQPGGLFVKVFCYIAIAFLILREYFQLTFVDRNVKTYLSKTSNRIEMTLIVVSCVTLALFHTNFNGWLCAFASMLAFLTLLTFLNMLPSIFTQSRLAMLRKVAIAFFSIYFGYIFVLICFSLIFPEKELGMEITDFLNSTGFGNITVTEDEGFTDVAKIEEDSQVLKTLKELLTTFWETFTIFVIVALLVIKDSDGHSDPSQYFVPLKQNAQKFIDTSQKTFEIYRQYRLDKKETNELEIFSKYIVKALKGRITKFPFLHKLDKIYVNLRTREVTIEVNKKQEKVLEQIDVFGSRSHLIDQHALDCIREIINSRN